MWCNVSMYFYVCMYVCDLCMYVCTYACMHACMFVCMLCNLVVIEGNLMHCKVCTYECMYVCMKFMEDMYVTYVGVM